MFILQMGVSLIKKKIIIILPNRLLLIDIFQLCSTNQIKYKVYKSTHSGNGQGASQLGGSLLGIPPGYKANKL